MSARWHRISESWARLSPGIESIEPVKSRMTVTIAHNEGATPAVLRSFLTIHRDIDA
jgi:hypothetical protein